MLLPFVVLLLGTLPAQAQFPVNESFRNSTASGWVLGGIGASPWNACLTSGNASCGNDPSGQGWLRLTDTGNDRAGYAYYDTAFPSNQGFALDFEYVSWGGTGADGIAAFFFDGCVPTCQAFRMGTPGGNFGYANQGSGCPTPWPGAAPGLSRGYLGIALDEYGNFQNPVDRCKNGGPGQSPDSISARGPGNGNTTSDYLFLNGTSTLAAGVDLAGGSSRPAPATYYRRVIVVVLPAGGGTSATYSVRWQTALGGAFTQILTGTVSSAMPTSLKLGFEASTGGSTNYHEIRNVRISYPADLAVTKVHAPANPVPGNTVTYTMVVTNNGPVNVTNAAFNDTIPAALTGVSWTCTPGTGASCSSAGGSGNTIGVNLTLANGAQATITASGTLAAGASGPLVNTATVTPPSEITDENPANNTATDTITSSADVAISKTASPSTLRVGEDVTYSLLVSSNGPWAATGVTVTDSLPASLTYKSASSTQGSCSQAGGTVTCTLGTMAPSTTATVTIVATTTATGTVNNTGSVTHGEADPTPANNSSSASITVTAAQSVDLQVTKGHSANPTPGSPMTYTMVVTNASTTLGITGATFSDAVPATLTGVTWTCAVTRGTGACSAATGSGNTINLSLNLNGTNPTTQITITATGTLSSGANQPLVNTATVATPPGTTDPTPGNNTATDTTTGSADVGITKIAIPATVRNTAARTVVFTLGVTNYGPWTATGVTVTDTIPSVFNTDPTATTTQGTCSVATRTVTCTLGTMPRNGTATITITATAPSGSTVGTYTNTATVTRDQTDPVPGNNSASASIVVTNATVTNTDLAVTKIHSGSPVPGGAVSYTLVVSNTGTDVPTATPAAFNDVVPPSIGSVTWSCTPAANCSPLSGSGNAIATNVNLTSGSSVTITVSGTLLTGTIGNVVNTATIAPPSGWRDNTPGNNTATDTFGPTANLALTKSASPTAVRLGSDTTFTLSVTNTGPWTATNVVVIDTLPAGLTYKSASSTQGPCSVTGQVVTCTIGQLNPAAPGNAATITIVATATALGTLTNSATTTHTESGTNPTATAQVTVTRRADLAVAKTHASVPAPGDNVSYTIAVTNNGPDNVTGASFADTVPSTLSNVTWTCAVTSGIGTCSAPSGSGNAIALTLGLNYGAQITVGVSGRLPVDVSGNVLNTAMITAPADTTDPTLGNNSSTDTVSALADVGVTKSASPNPVRWGDDVTFTIPVTSSGTWTATAVQLTDALPTGLTYKSASTTLGTCNQSGGTVTCSLGTMKPGASGTITIVATATQQGTITNTATTSHGESDPNSANNSASRDIYVRAADLAVSKSHSPDPLSAGEAMTYTIRARNNGADSGTGAQLTDNVPTAVQGVLWTCSVPGGSSCSPSSGSGNTISTVLSLANGAEAVITVNGTLRADYTGTLTNTVTVGAATDSGDPNTGNNTYTDNAPTVPVTLAEVVVERRGGMVAVAWVTESEVANVGFNLLGVIGGRPVALNEELIPGALQSFEPKAYQLEVADPGVEAVLIEEVGIHGATRRHGPFAVGETFGAPPERVAIDWPSIQREQARLTREWEATLPTTPVRARLYVDRDGIVRVTAEALKAAGLSFDGQRIDSLAVLEQGAGIPITVACASGAATARFGPGCYVEFPGAALDSLYTHTNVYTLAVDRQKATRIPLDTTLPSGDPVTTYQETTEVEREQAYSEASPTGDPWYETTMLAYRRPVSKEFPIDIDSPQPDGGEATLEVGLWGVTDWPAAPDHHVVVELNGVRAGEQTFDGTTDATMHLSVPRGVAKAGRNTLRLTLPGDTGVAWDMIAVDHYALTFARAAVARGGALTFGVSAKPTAVRGLRGPVVAYRRLEGQAIVRVQPQLKSDGAEQLTIVPGSRLYGVYGVADASGLLQPRIGRDPGSSLSLGGRADLLIVTHPTFLPVVEKYAAYKRTTGLSVKVVDTQTAYDVYGGGVVGPQPIRTLIAQAAQRMGVTAVLLVGGDTYDYFDYTGAGSISFVPTPYVTTSPTVTFAPVDPLYGDITGDEVPDLPVGRWPVRTVAELEAVIAKTITFAQRTDAPWALLAADRADGTYSFRGESDTLSVLLPAGWAQTKAYVDTLGVPATRQLILTSLAAGPLFANWFGHSSFGLWSFDDLFTTRDALGLTNTGKPFVVTQWGCWNTYHVLPSYDTLGHALLLSPDRGAAAVVGAATLTDSDNDRALASLFLPRLVQPGVSIGQALVDAKLRLAAARPAARDVILGTSLLGDPTLVLPAPGGAH